MKLYAISSLLWSYIIARTAAFGCSTPLKTLTWIPNLHANTWYRLTPIHCSINYRIFTYLPAAIVIANIPICMIHNTLIHSIVTIKLVSEHLLLTMFVVQTYPFKIIAIWAIVNTATNIFLAQIEPFGQIILAAGHLWILYVELYLIWCQQIVRKVDAEQRKSRVMIV